ncbi:ABC transporter permease [Herbivorax sp. ANBcel31]|uniref:ABC transporter permease n=1 Tax=Herbivorax sp. ANBcel31 TaxID=3069754 RepID=UPI0027B42CDF|nr:ABC transporter permease [Herbivorax sp. ANBcel31]MDQ2085391.1 ABC transporter permease [Herbivorax sp. ANBcel31]
MVYTVKKIIFCIKKNKLALCCAVFLTLIILLSIFVPLLSKNSSYAQDLKNTFSPPLSKGHLFGTDEFGRDLFVRVWEGARISLLVGFVAAVVQIIIGSIYGSISGILGGLMDEILMRVVDIIYSIPDLIIVILFTMIMGSSPLAIIFALSLTSWTGVARIVRGQTLMLREMEFVHAAKLLGAGNGDIVFRHILPNCSGSIMVNLMFSIPGAIFAESFLSFLGLGISIPKASLGTLASDGFRFIMYYPWLVMIPIVIIALTMISFNILGDIIKYCLEE